MEWYLKCMKQYVDFSGRARRKEYWMFALMNAIIAAALIIIDAGRGDEVLQSVYSLVVFLPSLAVGVRRMHDIGCLPTVFRPRGAVIYLRCFGMFTSDGAE